VVDGERVEYVDCSAIPVTFYRDLLRDVTERTSTAMAQEHAFTVTELAIRAESAAVRAGSLA
jgi:hypothetical protein